MKKRYKNKVIHASMDQLYDSLLILIINLRMLDQAQPVGYIQTHTNHAAWLRPMLSFEKEITTWMHLALSRKTQHIL